MAEIASGNEDVLTIEGKFMVVVALRDECVLICCYSTEMLCSNAKYQISMQDEGLPRLPAF